MRLPNTYRCATLFQYLRPASGTLEPVYTCVCHFRFSLAHEGSTHERITNLNMPSVQAMKRLSEEYDDWHRNIFTLGERPDQGSPWYQLVLEYLGPVSGKRILEVACGRGGFANVLQSLGATVCAVDFSAVALRIAQEKAHNGNMHYSKIAFSQADAHHLPFANGVFDFVISCETIEHLTDPSAALQEMSRVCKPGGLLYLTTPNYLNLMGLYLVYDAILRKDRHSPSTQPLDHRWLFLTVRRIVTRSGWKILKSDGTVHQVPFPGRNPMRLYFLERDPRLRRFLSPTAFHYFMLAMKRDT